MFTCDAGTHPRPNPWSIVKTGKYKFGITYINNTTFVEINNDAHGFLKKSQHQLLSLIKTAYFCKTFINING